MAKRDSRAGGFLLMSAILIGSVVGIALGDPMQGVLIGTAGGTVAAIVVWLLDARK